MPARVRIAMLLPLIIAATPAVASSTMVSATLDAAQTAMVRDPHAVVQLVGKAREQLGPAEDRASRLAAVRADWLEAEARGRLGESAKANEISARALANVRQIDANSKLHADLLTTQGGIALDENRMKDAFSSFQNAYRIFARLGEARSQAIVLQNIGTIYSYAGDQRSVLRYYAEARELYPKDPALSQAAANNLGTAYRELKDYSRAESEFRKAVSLAREMKSPVLEARALNNLASVMLAKGQPVAADSIADRGLRIARDEEASEWAPFLWGVKAQAALARGQVDRSLTLFERTFAGVDLKTTSFYFRDFHESAAKAYRLAGNMAQAYAHLAAFKRLDDEAREIRSSTNAALAAAQFDFSTQELRITKLRQGQLARDIKIERARARQQLILLLGTFALLIVTTIAFLWIRRSRNQTRLANRSLAASNTALDKALRAKSEFLATTSHEIRTPLNGILGMTQVLLGRKALEDGVRDQVRLIDSAGNTMKAIVDDILDMSQIEQGEVQVERTPVDLHSLMQDVAGLWRAAAEQKGLHFELDLTDAPARVQEDERKLRQIGFNLLSNAVKFTRTGSVRLRVSSTCEDGAERLLLAVEDTGIGIPVEQHEAIFEPFKQADSSTSREFGGTGLGLAISTKLAEALGGRITVKSEPGVGSTFTTTLPLQRLEAPEQAEKHEPATSLETASVAIVDDNPLFASMTEAVLSGARHVLTVDSEDELPAGADVVVLCGDVSVARAQAAAKRLQTATLIVLGTAEDGVRADAVLEQTMPPLALVDVIEEALAGALEPAVAA